MLHYQCLYIVTISRSFSFFFYLFIFLLIRIVRLLLYCNYLKYYLKLTRNKLRNEKRRKKHVVWLGLKLNHFGLFIVLFGLNFDLYGPCDTFFFSFFWVLHIYQLCIFIIIISKKREEIRGEKLQSFVILLFGVKKIKIRTHFQYNTKWYEMAHIISNSYDQFVTTHNFFL